MIPNFLLSQNSDKIGVARDRRRKALEMCLTKPASLERKEGGEKEKETPPRGELV